MRLLLLATLGSLVATPALAAEAPAPTPAKPAAATILRVINNSETDSAQVQGAPATAQPNSPTNGVGGTGGGRLNGNSSTPTNGTGGQGGGRITAPPVKPTGGK